MFRYFLVVYLPFSYNPHISVQFTVPYLLQIFHRIHLFCFQSCLQIRVYKWQINMTLYSYWYLTDMILVLISLFSCFTYETDYRSPQVSTFMKHTHLQLADILLCTFFCFATRYILFFLDLLLKFYNFSFIDSPITIYLYPLLP